MDQRDIITAIMTHRTSKMTYLVAMNTTNDTVDYAGNITQNLRNKNAGHSLRLKDVELIEVLCYTTQCKVITNLIR
jgi:hypothetical protein